MNTKIEAQKKFAEMVIAIADSNIEQDDYEIIQVYSLKRLTDCKIIYNYMYDVDQALELTIGLDGNLETYKVFKDEELLFASKDIEAVIEFINQEINDFESEIIKGIKKLS